MSADAYEPFDLSRPRGDGPLWGIASEELNATLLSWPPGEGVADHVNAERDVLIVVMAGSGLAIVDDEERPLRAGHALLIGKGSRRAIQAGDRGLRYLSVHGRRGPLQIDGPSP
jgi:quercetin dioxygenase-like cupin family protein